MLFRNDVKFEIPASDLEKLKKMKFPVAFKVLPEKYFKNALNGRNERPGGIIIPFEESVEDKEEGSVKWNYTKLPPKRNGEKVEYYQDGEAAHIMNGAKMYVQRNQLDLLYFMLNVSTVVKDSPMCQFPQIMQDDPVRESMSKNNVREMETQVRSALFGKQKMADSDIVRLAKAFQISGADTLHIEEVRDRLFESVEARQKDHRYRDGYSMFIELSGNEERLEILATIQKAKDQKSIVYVAKVGKWLTVDETGKKTGEVCNLVGGKTPEESLEHHAVTNPEVAEKIRNLISDLPEA